MADYGASVAGVRRLLPGVRVEADTEPSEEAVTAWVAEFTGEVATRIGDLATLELDPDDVAALELRARRLVHDAAASLTYQAVYPDRAGQTDSSYGDVLWRRYLDGLEALTVDVAAAIDGTTGAAGAGEPAYSFPDPLFRLDELH